MKIKECIVVEGLHDKIKLQNIVDATIIATEGFRIYKDKSKMELIRRMAMSTGIIILTDSDSAGFRIRAHIKNCVGDCGVVKHAYIPKVEGKERRKAEAGKEGILGVEGMTAEVLWEVLARATTGAPREGWKKVTKVDLYEYGLVGANSSEKRLKLKEALDLPPNISTNALLEISNSLYNYDELLDIMSNL